MKIWSKLFRNDFFKKKSNLTLFAILLVIICSLTIFIKTNLHYLDTLDKITIENLKFFLHFAYDPRNTDVDFTIILNVNKTNQHILERDLLRNAFGNSARLIDEFKSCQDSKNPTRNTFLIVRQNKDGGDLCAHAELVKSDFWLKNRDRYDYFFFINSSARGPFLPSYWIRKW